MLKPRPNISITHNQGNYSKVAQSVSLPGLSIIFQKADVPQIDMGKLPIKFRNGPMHFTKGTTTYCGSTDGFCRCTRNN